MTDRQKTAYLDCFSGISGNMALAAVIDAGASDRFIRATVKKVVREFTLSVKEARKPPLRGKLVSVKHPKRQPRRNLPAIKRMIRNSRVPEEIKEKSVKVFETLADAEAAVHGTSREKIHFHEVGAVDAIVDIVGTVAGLHHLGVKEIFCSALPMAGGEVETEHGLLPLPAPAVAWMVKGLPVRGVPGEHELVTPTGAALAVSLCASFGPMPAMRIESVGVGLGDRDIPGRPNLMRLFVGERSAHGDAAVQIEACIDDMPAERFDFLMERLDEAGALEVAFLPAQMKKNRPGVLVRVLTGPGSLAGVRDALLAHSTTLGVREYEVYRTVLPRQWIKVDTAYGPIRVKAAKRPGGGVRLHPEYEDLKKAAEKAGVDLETVEREAVRAALSSMEAEN